MTLMIMIFYDFDGTLMTLMIMISYDKGYLKLKS